MTKKKHTSRGSYECRVWGKHKKARKMLAELGTEVSSEEVEDCYFLSDDPDLNAKVRDNTLKIKTLVAEERGFERWTSEWHPYGEDTPAPFDQLHDDLRLDRPTRGKSFNIAKEVKRLDDDHDARPVFVTKRRQHYQVGELRAEVSDIEIDATGKVLRTIAIEGKDLDALVALRKKLGLKGLDNVAVHVAIDPESNN